MATIPTNNDDVLSPSNFSNGGVSAGVGFGRRNGSNAGAMKETHGIVFSD